MISVLVTGAAGFLGRSVVQQLEQQGRSVLATDRSGDTKNAVQPLDISDPQQVNELFAHNDISAVVHLAAAGYKDMGLAAGANADPAQAVQTNVLGFINLLQACKNHGVPKLVWASSSTIYGTKKQYAEQYISEDAVLRPQILYGVTKATCEQMAPLLAEALGVQIVSVRLPMVYAANRWYGGSQQQLVDLVEAYKQRQPIKVAAWGEVVDWIHVDDAAAAMLSVLESSTLTQNAYHTVGHRGSLRGLLEVIIAGLDWHEASVEGSDGHGPDLPFLDDRAIRADTPWQPQFSTEMAAAEVFARELQASR